MTGFVLLVAVLGAATVFGLYRKRMDGRMRTVEHPDLARSVGDPADPADPGRAAEHADVAPVKGASRAAPAAGDVVAPERAEAVEDARAILPADDVSEPLVVGGVAVGPTDHSVVPATNVLSAVDLGAALGQRATLVQFSSAFCQPCRVTRVVLADVASTVPGVAHVEIDAESRLDLVRRVDVTRTPTVLILDAAGRIRTRATGAPRMGDVLGALAAVL